MSKVVLESMSNNGYADWLSQQGAKIYRSEAACWQLYQHALIPVSVSPAFPTVTKREAWSLLRSSRAMFLRYSSDPSNEETPWWYIVCDSFDPKKIGSKIRQNINRGNRNCVTKRIEPQWLADNGYACYKSAYQRYSNALPGTEEKFKASILSSVGGPFEWWGVFVGEDLAGYSQCVVEGNAVNTSITKYDPGYLKLRTAYSLVTCLVDDYVVKRGMTINNGNRAVAHDTNYQDFLVNLGYRRQFCRLNIIYRPWLGSFVKAASRFHGAIDRLPDKGPLHSVKALLRQEVLRESTQK